MNIPCSIVIDPNTRLICPVCHDFTAEIVGRYIDEDDNEVTGEGATFNEVVMFKCGKGDEWSQYSRRQQILMIGWGPDWRYKLDDL